MRIMVGMLAIVGAAGIAAFAQDEKAPEAAAPAANVAEITVAPPEGGAAAAADAKSAVWKKSYAMGFELGHDMSRSFKASEMEFDPDAIARGLKDAYTGAEPQLAGEELNQATMELHKEMMERRRNMEKARAEKNANNKEKGQAFLDENKKRKEVKVTPSGLQYEVITEGKGASPKATDRVKVHYRGTLIDGTEFDSSYKAGQPVEFRLNEVIKGWTEGVQLMKVGGKCKLYLPPDLAYGRNGAGGVIGPDSTLIFEVELVAIVK